MNLQEILDEIAERYPHGLSNDSVIRKINFIQRQLFRTVYRVNTLAQYDIIADVFAYPLPAPRSEIIDVVVGDQEYRYYGVQGQAPCRWWYVTDADEMGIYPTPDQDIPDGLLVSYYKSPASLSTNTLSATPELDSDYHMLLVYGALVQICEVFQDTSMVNNFTQKYNDMLDDAYRVFNRLPDAPKVEEVMGGGWLL